MQQTIGIGNNYTIHIPKNLGWKQDTSMKHLL